MLFRPPAEKNSAEEFLESGNPAVQRGSGRYYDLGASGKIQNRKALEDASRGQGTI